MSRSFADILNGIKPDRVGCLQEVKGCSMSSLLLPKAPVLRARDKVLYPPVICQWLQPSVSNTTLVAQGNDCRYIYMEHLVIVLYSAWDR